MSLSRRFLSALVLAATALTLAVLPAPADAAHGTIIGAGSDYQAKKLIRGAQHPKYWAAFSPPADVAPGDTYRVDCTIEAYRKTGMRKPKKGLSGNVVLLLVSLDVGSLTWTFEGVTESGLEFTTNKQGVALVTTGQVTASDFFDDPGTNDTITGWVDFTGGPKVKQTFFRCEFVHEAATASPAP